MSLLCVTVLIMASGCEAMLYDRWCGTTLYQGRDPPSLLQALLEPEDGFR